MTEHDRAGSKPSGGVQGLIGRADRVQQRHSWLAFAYAVIKKFGDDRGGQLAALMAYYGFFSLFPLLLLLFTVLAMVLGDNSSLRESIQDSALAQFPIIGTELRENIGSVRGSGVALGVGIVGSLWGGLGVTQAAQTAMNEIWAVPKKERPNFFQARLRGLIILGLLGSMTLASTVLAGFGAAGGSFFPARLLGLLGSLLLNFGLFLIAFRVLTERDLTWGQVFPGAAVAAILWSTAQVLGGFIVATQVKNASDTYGFFGVVIGLLAWLYLGATITLYAAEINMVRVNRLWPRSLQQELPLTGADERSLVDAAKVEERIREETVDVSFHEDPPTARPG